jgi:hypothetical protein
MARKQTPGEWCRSPVLLNEMDATLALIGMDKRRGLECVAVHQMATGWAKKRGTDGTLTAGVLPMIHALPIHATLLVRAGLWEERAGGGWRLLDYPIWQETAAEVDQARAKKAANGALGLCKRWHPQPCTVPNCTARPSNVVPLQLEEHHA